MARKARRSLPTTVKIGDRWARTISEAFLQWAEDVRLDGRNMPVTIFDPSPQIEACFMESIESQLEYIGRTTGMGVSLDLVRPESVAWIKKYAGDQVQYIDRTTKEGIRKIILAGHEEGLAIPEQTKRIKELIGLHPKQVDALRAFEESMGPGADRAVERYANRLLRTRAETIALTETHTAANEGQRAANAGAVERGILDPAKYERSWLVTPDDRLCPVCEGLDGARAELPSGDFDRGGGRGPPRHPRCRCCEIIVERR